jgi:cysteine desulfurase
MEPSHVLRAMRVPFQLARGAIRFSLSRETSGGEIDRALEILPAVVAQLRGDDPDQKTDSVTYASESGSHHAPVGVHSMEELP